MEIIKGAMHEFAIPVVHIVEVAVVLWVANKMIKYDEQEKLRFIKSWFVLINKSLSTFI